jgi:hypothetical protein
MSDMDLRARIAQIQKLNLPIGAKRRMALMLMEASSPNRLDVNRQAPGRREDMRSTMDAVKTSMGSVMSRALDTLSRISPEEFDRLVEQANKDKEDAAG